MIENPKLTAILAVKSQVQSSQTNLGAWTAGSEPGANAGVTVDAVDDGLTEDVWTSPVADDYRTKISTQVSGIDSIASALVQDLTHAENTIYNDGLEYVEPDSPEARWPSS